MFFSPMNIAKVLEGMAALQYKDSRLMDKFWEKIRSQVDPDERARLKERLAKIPMEEKLRQAVKGGQLKGRSPGYYIYEGFENSEQMTDMLNILMEWEVDRKEEHFIETPEAGEGEEFDLIKGSLEQLSQVVVEGKRLQAELLGSVNELKV